MTARLLRLLKGGKPDRLQALRRFAAALTLLNLLGHTVLGFEQSWAQPLVAIAAAYSTELVLELFQAWSTGRKPRFRGGVRNLIDFLLPAHITGLACAMLLYANERLWPMAFAAIVAITSKTLFRVTTPQGPRHFLNPSNTGIALTLLLFPSVGISPPYHFTENLDGVGDWLLPAVLLLSGSFLNARFTGRVPLIMGWIGGFVAQAFCRSLITGAPVEASLIPMTGTAFVTFTLFMITDPGTTPLEPRSQRVFGAGVAAAYGLLMALHVVFGMFFALLGVCMLRGLCLAAQSETVPAPSRIPEVVSRPAALLPTVRAQGAEP